MSRAVDTRIVQMQFDNRDFEKNIEKSGKSLDNFKEKLDFDKYEKGLSNFQASVKNLTFDSLINNVQKIADKFTGLGTIGELVCSQIRGHIESLASKISGLFDQLGMSQVTAGLGKYEEMNKNVQTIMAATGKSESEVYSVLSRLNQYTDQTSYNFTDMANNIGKFTSVGIPLEKAEKQMEGIANWAARSGAGINEASRAMYNLSQAMGVGSLKLMDWKSIENAGMATKEFKEQLIDAGIAAGTLIRDAKTGTVKTAAKFGKQIEVNYQNLSQSLSKGWANTQVLGDTLEKYYWDQLTDYDDVAVEPIMKLDEDQKKIFDKMFADDNKISKLEYKSLAAKGIVTDDVKEKLLELAVESGKITKTISEDGETIYTATDKAGKKIEFTMENVEESLKAGWFDKALGERMTTANELGKVSYEAAQKCRSLTDVFEAWKDQLSTGWMRSWQLVFGELSESMEIFSAICNKVGDQFSHFIEMLVGNGEDLPGIIGSWANGGGRESLWAMFIGEYDGMYEGAYGLLDILHDIGGLIKDGFWDLVYTIYSILDSNPVSKDEWDLNEQFKQEFLGGQIERTIDNIRNFIQGIRDFFEAVPEGSGKSRIQMLRETVSGIAHAILLAYTAVRDTVNFFKGIVKQFQPSIDAILSLLAALGLGIKDASKEAYKGNGLKVLFDSLLKIIEPLTSAFNYLITTIAGITQQFVENGEAGNAFTSIWEKIQSVIQFVAKAIVRIVGPLVTFLGTAFSAIVELFEGGITTEKMVTFGEKIKNALKTMINSIFGFDIVGRVKGIIKSVKNVFSSGFSPNSVKVLKLQIKGLFKSIFDQLPTGVKEGLKNAWTKVKEFFKPFIDDVADVFKSGFSSASIEKLKNRFKIIFSSIWDKLPDGLKTGIKNIYNKIKDRIQPLFDAIKNIFKNGLNKESFGKLKEAFKNIFGKVFDMIPQGIKDKVANNAVVQKIKGIIEPVWNSIKDFFSKIFNFGKDFGGEFKESFKNANLFTLVKEQLGFGMLAKFIGGLSGIVKGTNLYGIAMSFLGGYSLIKLIKMFKEGSNALGGIKTFFGGMNDILSGKKGIKDLLFGNAEQKTENFGDKLLKIAKGVALIVAAVTVLAIIPINKLAQGVIALGIIMGLVLGFIWILQKLISDLNKVKTVIKTLYSVGLSILMISIGVAILIKALKPLADMNITQLSKMLTSFGVIMLLMVMFAKSMDGIKMPKLGGMIGLALAIAILILALKPLANIEWEGLAKMGVGLIAIITILVIFSKKVGYMKGSGMGSILMVTAAIWILIKALLPLAALDWGSLAKMGAGLAFILTVLVLFTKHTSRMKDSGMNQLLSVTGSIWMVLDALKPLATYSWSALAKMGAGLVLLMYVLTRFTQDSQSMKGMSMVQLIFVAGTIWLLLESLKPIAEYSWESLAKMAATMVFMTLIVVLMSKFMKSATNVQNGVGTLIMLVGLAAVLLAFGAAMSMLKDIKWETIAVATLGIVVLLVVFMLVMKTMKKMKITDIAKSASVMLMLLGLCAVMITFGLALKMAKDVDPTKMIAFAAALSLIILAMAGALAIVSLIKNPGAMLIGIAAIAAGIAAVMGAIALMLPVLADSLGTALEKVSSKLAIISTMFRTFSGNMDETDESSLESAKRKFEILISICKSCWGIDKYYDSIRSFEECMLMLGNGVSMFEQGSKNVGDPESSNGIKMIRSFLDMKDDLAGFTIGNMATEIFGLGEAVSLFAFSTALVGKNPPGLTLLKDLCSEADNLKKLSEVPLDTLKSNLSGLGGALSIYAEGASEVSMIEEGNMPDISKAVDLMHKVTESFSGENGKFEIPDIPDEASISGFGADIAALAAALKKFAQASVGLANTDKALEVLAFMRDLKTDLTEENLLTAEIFRKAGIPQSTITSFGLEIAALGDALSKYDQSVANFKGNQNAYDALTFFKQLRTDLQQADLVAVVTSFDALGTDGEQIKDVLTTFATNIGELGLALSGFADNVNFDDEKQKKFEAAIKSLEDMRTIARTLPVIGGISGFIHGNVETLSQMADDITAIGGALKNFSDALNQTGDNQKTFDSEMADAAIETLNSFASLAYYMSAMDYGSAFESLHSLSEFLRLLNENSAGNVTFGNGSPMVHAMAKLMHDLEGAIDLAGGVKHLNYFEAFKNIAQGISALANVDPELDFEAVGSNIAKGVQAGIENGSSDVINATIEMVKQAIEAANDTAKIASPSRVFMQMGDYMTKGLAIGIRNTSNEPANAASKMVDDLIHKGPLANISSILAGEIDPNPTITPVLDLSNVSTGLQSLGGMFNGQYGVNLNGGSFTLNPNGTSMLANLANPLDYTSSIDSIKTEVGHLRSDLRTLSDAVGRMKFVFNTGAVVAAIGPEMDEYLGRQGFYSARTEIS